MAKVNPAFLPQQEDSFLEAGETVECRYDAWIVSYAGADSDALANSIIESIRSQLGAGMEAAEIQVEGLAEKELSGEFHVDEEEVPSQDWTASIVVSLQDSGQLEDTHAEVDALLAGPKDFQDNGGLIRMLELTAV